MNQYNFCMATHPDKPVMSRNSRGRVIHLTKTETKTICNMLISEVFDLSNGGHKMVVENRIERGRVCKVCFNGKQKIT